MITNQKRGIKNIKGIGCTMGQHAVLRLSLIVRKKMWPWRGWQDMEKANQESYMMPTETVKKLQEFSKRYLSISWKPCLSKPKIIQAPTFGYVFFKTLNNPKLCKKNIIYTEKTQTFFRLHGSIKTFYISHNYIVVSRHPFSYELFASSCKAKAFIIGTSYSSLVWGQHSDCGEIHTRTRWSHVVNVKQFSLQLPKALRLWRWLSTPLFGLKGTASGRR